MNEMTSDLTCLECGKPIPGSRRWVCDARCHAVINLVQYGRNNRSGSLVWPDQDRLNRLRRRAKVIGHFPTWDVWIDLRERDKECCQYQRCGQQDAQMIDWKSDDPVLTRVVRSDDLRTTCAQHQREEALRRFVGPLGQVARTAPAIWARIEAAKPLVHRDDERLWASDESWSLLTNWPLASEVTRRDLHDWADALGQPSAASDRGAHLVVDVPHDDFVAAWDAALGRLALPTRRREHLVRAINALFLRLRADEATLAAMEEEVDG